MWRSCSAPPPLHLLHPLHLHPQHPSSADARPSPRTLLCPPSRPRSPRPKLWLQGSSSGRKKKCKGGFAPASPGESDCLVELLRLPLSRRGTLGRGFKNKIKFKSPPSRHRSQDHTNQDQDMVKTREYPDHNKTKFLYLSPLFAACC